MKEPIRTCIGCGSKKPKRELARLWIDHEGIIRVSSGKCKRKYPGKGSYICTNDDCIDNVKKNGRISKRLGRDIQMKEYTELINIASGGE